MSEPTGRGADVDAAGEHGGGGEVAEVVEPQAVEAVTPGEAAEGERDVVRAPWFDAVGSMGEDEGVRRDVGAAEGEELARDVSVLGEHPDGSVVERDAPFGVGLGALFDHI